MTDEANEWFVSFCSGILVSIDARCLALTSRLDSRMSDMLGSGALVVIVTGVDRYTMLKACAV